MPGKECKFNVELNKVDVDKKVAYGWAYVSKKAGETVIDVSGQTWPMGEVTKTAHQFAVECRDGGLMHVLKGVATMVESVVFSAELQKSLGIDLGQEGWFVGFRIDDDTVLKGIEDGTYSMFSIGGTGIEEMIDA